MFNLEQSIADWRAKMLAAGIKTPVPLEELEIHLREEIERQVKSGLSEQEIFNSAIQKIGQAHTVQNEFKKIAATKEEREWKFVQILLLISVSLGSALLGGMELFKIGNCSALTSGQQMSDLAALATLPLLVWGGRLGCGMFPAIRAKRIRDAIVYSCSVPALLWLIVFANVILPRYDFTLGQLQVAISWGVFTPLGALVGLTLGIENAAREKIEKADLSASQS
jgi:hypothetical protein